jgi:predicted transcriptional regulator
MARNSKMTARKNISRKIANPFTQLWDGAQSKSAVLFDMLKTKNGAHVEDLVQATGWNVATVRVRLNQIGKLGYTVANVGGYGDSVYKLVA